MPPRCARAPLLSTLVFLRFWGGLGDASPVGGPSRDETLVLPPVAEGPEKMLVLIPGGLVPLAHYERTAKAIQRLSTGMKLWVVIPAVTQRLCIIECAAAPVCQPLSGTVEAALSLAKSRGWVRGDDSKDLWLGGHSLGGVCASTLFKLRAGAGAAPYAGQILMGSYLDEAGPFDLANSPKPVLILNAELDGKTRPGKTATWWRQHLEVRSAKGEAYAASTKPVIVLPGMNHSQFCPGFDVPGDLAAEVSQDEATEAIAQTAAAFLHVQTFGNESSSGDAQALLRRRLAWTSTLLTPYLSAQDTEHNATAVGASPEGASPLCGLAQHVIAGLSDAYDAKVTVVDGYHQVTAGLVACHPSSATVTGGRLLAQTCSHADYYAGIDNSGQITAARQVACKMLSSERLAGLLNTTAARPGVTCREVNKLAVRIAETLALPGTLRRHRAAGRGFCFLEDTPVAGNIGPAWVYGASLKLEANATCLAVSSPVLKTRVDGKIYPGSHYCKVLSPARALDWIMTDSLRPRGGSGDKRSRAEPVVVIV